MSKSFNALLASFAICCASASSAATHSKIFDFSASFSSGPYSVISGSFSTLYDDEVEAFTLKGIDLTIGSKTFDFDTEVDWLGMWATGLAIGGIPHGLGALGGKSDDFYLQAWGRGGKLDSYFAFAYSTISLVKPIIASDVTITERISAVPEPAAWAMMIGGFALAGAALRRRKTSIVFV